MHDSFRSQLPDVRHSTTSPGVYPVDHHSFWPEGDHLHHHHPPQKCALCFQDPDNHLQSLQQALTCHRPSAAPGPRYVWVFREPIHSSINVRYLFIKYYVCTFLFFLGSYLQEAPVIIDKPEIVYVMENQSVTITVTLNHVNATVIWKRYVCC